MISDMTKMDISNASLLDEGTAAAEAMSLCFNAKKKKKNTFIVSEDCHPQVHLYIALHSNLNMSVDNSSSEDPRSIVGNSS